MSKNAENTGRKAAMKVLRGERRVWIKAAARKVKANNRALRAIREQLKEKPRTVPEIAEGAKLSTSDVMWYVASMKKFGEESLRRTRMTATFVTGSRTVIRQRRIRVVSVPYGRIPYREDEE